VRTPQNAVRAQHAASREEQPLAANPDHKRTAPQIIPAADGSGPSQKSVQNPPHPSLVGICAPCGLGYASGVVAEIPVDNVHGVSDKTTPDGRNFAGAILGVPKPAEAIKWMEEAFTNYVYPAVSRPHIAQIPTDEQTTILVVNIEPEPSLVAVWNRQRGKEKHGMEFLYRTNHGKSWMTPDEVAIRMNDRHRMIRLSLGKLLQESTDYDESKGTPVTLLHHVTRSGSFTGVQNWEHEALILDLGRREFTLRLTESVKTGDSHKGEVTIAYDWILSHWWDRRRGGRVDRPAIQLNAGFSFDGGGQLRITHPSTR
jgi:hypothetical protein